MERLTEDHRQQHIDRKPNRKASKRLRSKKRRHDGTPFDTKQGVSSEKRNVNIGCGDELANPTKGRRLENSPLPLKGKVVALSSALVNINTKNENIKVSSSLPTPFIHAGDESDSGLSYKELAALCHSAGAEVTSMVHKRVFCLIVTDAAAVQHTQRIRKAQKYGIPIVSVTWLAECLSQHQIIPFQRFEFEPSGRAPDIVSAAVKPTKSESSAEMSERTVELGCCCLCHEHGTSDTCEWCVDCRYEAG